MSNDFSMSADFSILQELIGKAPDILDAWLESNVAIPIVLDMQESMSQSSGGAVYMHDGEFYTASKPGDAPNVDTGALANSLQVTKVGQLEYATHDGVDYGIFLELGTSKMAARPFVVPVYLNWETHKFAQAAGELQGMLK